MDFLLVRLVYVIKALGRSYADIIRYEDTFDYFFKLIGFVLKKPKLFGKKDKISVVTFSVFSGLASIWYNNIFKILNKSIVEVYIFTSSVSNPFLKQKETKFLPNLKHGTKIDIIIKNCRSKYILLCDDDIFWLNDSALLIAKKKMESNSNIACISLQPRPKANYHSKLKMGVYCLMINKEIILKEKLLFGKYKIKKNGFIERYETGDHVQKILEQKGYKIEYLKIENMTSLLAFYAISHWGLKIRKRKGNILPYLQFDDSKAEKIYKTSLMIKYLNEYLFDNLMIKKYIINPSFVEESLSQSKRYIDSPTLIDIEMEIKKKIQLLKKG